MRQDVIGTAIQKLAEWHLEISEECDRLREERDAAVEQAELWKADFEEAAGHATRRQEELRKACAERDELRKDQTQLQRICADGGRRIAELKAELDATRKQLQDVLFEQEEADDAPTEPKKPKKPVKTPAGQSDLVRDVSHYTEAAEVDRPIEPQPKPEKVEEQVPQPVQVREGRWLTRGGEVRNVTRTPDENELRDQFPWWDANTRNTWREDGRYVRERENVRDLVQYLGPIESRPKSQSGPWDVLRRLWLRKLGVYAGGSDV